MPQLLAVALSPRRAAAVPDQRDVAQRRDGHGKAGVVIRGLSDGGHAHSRCVGHDRAVAPPQRGRGEVFGHLVGLAGALFDLADALDRERAVRHGQFGRAAAVQQNSVFSRGCVQLQRAAVVDEGAGHGKGLLQRQRAAAQRGLFRRHRARELRIAAGH